MSESNTAVFASGHCLCGAVQFSVTSPPLRAGQCHCEDCQRATGTGHASVAFFQESAVSIQGETQGYGSPSDYGTVNTRYFCPTCGSRLFSRDSSRPGIITINAGVFNDKSWYQPARIVYHRNKPSWDFMDPQLPTFETMPPV